MVTAVQFSASTQHHLGRGAPPERLPERAQCGSDRRPRMARMAAPGGCGQIRAPLTATVKNTSVGAAEADLGCRRAAGRGGADNKKGNRNGPEVALGSHVREGELRQSALGNPGAVMMF